MVRGPPIRVRSINLVVLSVILLGLICLPVYDNASAQDPGILIEFRNETTYSYCKYGNYTDAAVIATISCNKSALADGKKLVFYPRAVSKQGWSFILEPETVILSGEKDSLLMSVIVEVPEDPAPMITDTITINGSFVVKGNDGSVVLTGEAEPKETTVTVLPDYELTVEVEPYDRDIYRGETRSIFIKVTNNGNAEDVATIDLRDAEKASRGYPFEIVCVQQAARIPVNGSAVFVLEITVPEEHLGFTGTEFIVTFNSQGYYEHLGRNHSAEAEISFVMRGYDRDDPVREIRRNPLAMGFMGVVILCIIIAIIVIVIVLIVKYSRKNKARSRDDDGNYL